MPRWGTQVPEPPTPGVDRLPPHQTSPSMFAPPHSENVLEQIMTNWTASMFKIYIYILYFRGLRAQLAQGHLSCPEWDSVSNVVQPGDMGCFYWLDHFKT